jgi:hypothetical protein
MDLNDLANLGQIIGALAVVISLFYVAHQIRQNTNAVRSATAQTVHEHFAKWYHLVAADDELAQIVAKGLRDYGSLSEKERVRFVATFMAFLSYTQNAFLKWREGLLASPLWMGWEHVIMNLVGAPGGKAFWKDRAYMFGDEFRRYVETDLMKREPHPDAKPMGAFPIGAAFAHESHGKKSKNADSWTIRVIRGLLLIFAADTAAATTIARKIHAQAFRGSSSPREYSDCYCLS